MTMFDSFVARTISTAGAVRATSVLLILILTTESACACLGLVQTWKAHPTAETVEQSAEIYLARLTFIDAVDESHSRLTLNVLERMRGPDVESVTISVPFASHRLDGDKIREKGHEDPEFWLGERNNAYLWPDCNIFPNTAHVNRTYLLLLSDSSMTSLVSFEPVDSLSTDRWLRFVRRYSQVLELTP